jgi:glycerol-1-phosphate dehydrogenase [NAD(P)+]
MEHTIGHLLDMSADYRGKDVSFHGAQVGVASIISAIVWQIFIKEFDPSDIDVNDCFPSENDMYNEVYKAFSHLDEDQKVALECWKSYEKKLKAWHNNKESFTKFLDNWETFKEEVSDILQTPDFLSDCMHKTHAPTRFHLLSPSIDKNTAMWAIKHCHLYRNRFTLADMLFYIGWWNDELIQRVLYIAESMDVGL